MDQIERNNKANFILTTIRNFERIFPDEFAKCDIKRCGHCNSTGLENIYNMSEFCKICHGIGYLGYSKIFDEFVCRSCSGIGCNVCKDKGYIDWVVHAKGSDITEKRIIMSEYNAE